MRVAVCEYGDHSRPTQAGPGPGGPAIVRIAVSGVRPRWRGLGPGPAPGVMVAGAAYRMTYMR